MSRNVFLICIIIFSCNLFAQSKSSEPKGPYIGQIPPDVPEVFVLGVITTQYDDTGTPTFSDDMNEVYWSSTFIRRTPEVILYMKKVNNQWTQPEVASFSGQYSDGSPFFSPDNKRLYFHSNRPINGKGEPKDFDIWYVEKTDKGWSKPFNAGGFVNTEKNEFYPTVSKKGTLYYSSFLEGYVYDIGIFKSEQVNNKFTKSTILDEKINSKKGYNFCSYIDPDERFILFCSGRDGQEFDDIYCSFKDDNNSWSNPIKFDTRINEGNNERSPRITPDGRSLIFCRISDIPQKTFYEESQTLQELKERYNKMSYDIYWTDAKIIYELKSNK